MKTSKSIPLPTIRRLPRYYNAVSRAIKQNREFISTSELALTNGFTTIQVRKDIEYTAVKGKTRLGYPCQELETALAEILGLEVENKAVIIGVGHLGQALLGYKGFENSGIHITAGFDIKPIETKWRGLPILGIEKLSQYLKKEPVQIGILTVPADQAQRVTDFCISAGLKGFWNFSPTMLEVPSNVLVKNVDMAFSLASLFAEYKLRKI